MNKSYLLPDCYRKDPESNNYKLLEIGHLAIDKLMNDIIDTKKSKDLTKAYGATLEYFGNMIGQLRGSLDDNQYRYLLYMRIGKNLVTGNYNSVIGVARSMLGMDDNSNELAIDDAEGGNVHIRSIPLATLVASGFSSRQAIQLIKQLLPIGVGIITDGFEGTFEFDSSENVYDESKGFADLNNSFGGYLGLMLGDDDNAPVLPLR
nr:MAG TPA: Protein of unknown function (DUF2612) [Caudoviricetes sp.]